MSDRASVRISREDLRGDPEKYRALIDDGVMVTVVSENGRTLSILRHDALEGDWDELDDELLGEPPPDFTGVCEWLT